ncbi:hypothetical protein JCM14467A_25350 [Vulcanisaeta sp. JCM 14467]
MALAIVIIVLTTVLMMSNNNEVIMSNNALTPIGINVPIYVVGSPMLVQKLTALGINQSLIKLTTTEQLPELPNDSLVIIDWSVIGPGIIINEGNTTYVNTNSTDFKLIEELIRRGDFIIIHGNTSEVPIIEYTLAFAWSRAYNVSTVLTPGYVGNLDYVIAYGNAKALLIGPHSLESALKMASNIWVSIIRKQAITDPDDLCASFLVNTNQPINFNGTYVIIYGPRSYSDSLGSATIDFCIIWNGLIYRNLNGYSVGYAQVYNFIMYAPNSSTYIKYIELFQDAYASYMAHEYGLGKINASQLPGDIDRAVIEVGNYSLGYWTINYYAPYPMHCTTTEKYRVTLTLGYTGQAPTASSNYYCTQTTITVHLTPSKPTPIGQATNITWTLTLGPWIGRQANAYGTMAEGYTYMGPTNNPQPSMYIIPVGASITAYKPYGCTYHLLGFIPIPGILIEHIAYDINWHILINPNGTMNPQSHGTYIPPPGISKNWRETQSPYTGLQEFYHTTQCQPIWWLWW